MILDTPNSLMIMFNVYQLTSQTLSPCTYPSFSGPI